MQLTPKMIAAELNTDPKVVRRFLRTLVDGPGKGGKWAIDDTALPYLTERFAAYSNRTNRTITIDDLTDDATDETD